MRTVFVAETESDAARVRDALEAERARLVPSTPKAAG